MTHNVLYPKLDCTIFLPNVHVPILFVSYDASEAAPAVDLKSNHYLCACTCADHLAITRFLKSPIHRNSAQRHKRCFVTLQLSLHSWPVCAQVSQVSR